MEIKKHTPPPPPPKKKKKKNTSRTDKDESKFISTLKIRQFVSGGLI